MSNVRPFHDLSKKTESAGPDWQRVVDGIKLLLSALPPDEQERVLREVAEKIPSIPAPRAGNVLGAVVKLLPRRPQWTLDEIKRGVASRGVEATPKEIYNSLGYLVRKGRVRRIGYGQYAVGGAGIVTSDDLGGEPPPMEDGEI